MSVKFQKPNRPEGVGSKFDSGECLRGLNLLGHAQWIELDLGSTCGGHGKCGLDRIFLNAQDQAKVNPVTEIEKNHLTAEEIAKGYRLACQTFPNRDGDEIMAHL